MPDVLEFVAYDNEPLTFWVANAYKILDRYTGNGETFVDVGAHLGIVSILAIKERGFKRAIAVEAFPSNYLKMLDNIAHHKCNGKILPILAAITNDPPLTPRDLGYIPGGNSGTASLSFGGAPVHFSVPSLHLENLYGIIGVPDFLKIDIEGGEWDVLDQIDSQYLDIELHPKVGIGAGGYVLGTFKNAKKLLAKKYKLTESTETEGLYGFRK